MKSTNKIGLSILTLFIALSAYSQETRTNLKKIKKMETINSQTSKKEAITNLYEIILNQRKLDLLPTLISENYTNSQGGTGSEGFKKGITDLLSGFPDAQWSIENIFAAQNKVVVKQIMKGTHTNTFQNIAATGKAVQNEGFVIYEFENEKIISHQIQTDRLGFLQQLEVISPDFLTPSTPTDSSVFFVDKFFIPNNAIKEFTQRMQYNRNFIKTLPGFLNDKVIARHDTSGNLELVTIAEWENQDYLDNAKIRVQKEYQRIDFNPADFTKRLNIVMERQQYSPYYP